MLTRFITRPSHLRLLTLISSPNRFSNPSLHPLHTLLPAFSNPYSDFYFFSSRCFSSDHKNNDGGNSNDQPTSTTGLWKISPENDQSVDSVFGEDRESIEGISGSHPTLTTDVWKISTENDQTVDSVFGDDTGSPEGISGSYEQPKLEESWLKSPADGIDAEGDLFKGIEKEVGESTFGEDNIFKGIGMEVERGGDDWARADGYKSWTLGEEEKGRGAFDIGEDVPEMRFGDVSVDIANREEQIKKSEEDKRLQEEEKVLSAVLKGPNRAFGDLIATSGITDAMLDGLLILKDLDDVPGLPPLQEIEDIRYEKNTRKSSRADIERQKQEEVANARVRQVDENGRAYGTGRRKCSVARVWVEPGDGRFVVNDKEFDVYFPMLDHRAALLRPFSETKTLGLWDIRCTVKGGGVSGQVGAIQLGISRALQNWEPDLRPPLRAAGFLTRDPRVVERKKPGKAKARKSFQWVKR